MTMLRYLIIITTAAVITAGCQKSTGGSYKDTPVKAIFNGNALQYLQSQPGVYDSMLRVINLLPGLSELVSTRPLTIFALSNKNFEIAFKSLNNARSQQNLPPVVSLEQLDIPLLDTLFSRYIIEGIHTVDGIPGSGEGLFVHSARFNNQMNLIRKSNSASGFLGGGEEQIAFSDTNGSVNIAFWQTTTTQTVNIITNNAVVHPLVTGHEFGFTKFAIEFLNN